MKLSMRRKIIEEIRLLCQCGVGLEAIASPLCDATRRLAGADAAALFWHDREGSILGFCHDLAPDEIKELFITRFDELFSSPGGNHINDLILLSPVTIGSCLDPPAEYFESANFLMLLQPMGHHWAFDCRVVTDGVTRATMLLYNAVDRPFDRSYVALLRPVQLMMQTAVEAQKSTGQWQQEPLAHGSLVADAAGRTLVAISASARALFARCQMMLYDKTTVGMTARAPSFVMQLAQMLADRERAQIRVGVVGGRLAATATRLCSVEPAGGQSLSVDIIFERSQAVLSVEYVRSLAISPLQRKILLYALLGGTRADCPEEFGVTNEALKKHLRLIFRATGSETWRALQRPLPQPVA